MRIKQSKPNELLKLLLENNFDPLEFTLPELSKMKFNGTKFTTGYATEYKFGFKKNDHYYFSFFYHDSAMIYEPRYYPGVKYDDEMIKGSVSLDKLKEVFNIWLQDLKK